CYALFFVRCVLYSRRSSGNTMNPNSTSSYRTAIRLRNHRFHEMVAVEMVECSMVSVAFDGCGLIRLSFAITSFP
ncbi:MAG: hypothetical protein QM755_07390, partial [Luteolibacter sp.]